MWNPVQILCLIPVFAVALLVGIAGVTSYPISSSTASPAISANELDAPLDLEGSPIDLTTTTKKTTTTTTTTERIPVFNRNRVSLEVASDLFSSSTSVALGLSNMLGNMVRRTSVRIAQLVRLFQPLFGYHLMIDVPKELDT
ncbi:uncharacterized protein LOC125952832 [Anopheles darlingi]|uniref:uncharacterized protein LOC125952832 n=1 Tax=Anopheles darlingi TaxID=43151 RepID=UPI0021004477|nr:uncharacterized protein LOC125952832 [Anopheles darlingi]